MPQISINSPVGALTIFEFDDQIVSLDWGFVEEMETSPVLNEAKAQINAYFAKKLHRFDLPLAPGGTTFQAAVWAAIRDIPLGQTATYQELARAAGSPKGFRAVGMACGKNPIPILIPCHRVLATGGKPGGYSGDGGLETKEMLLRLEGVDLYNPGQDQRQDTFNL
ncbi:cysteine methyltransferase [Thalassospira profundimaris]|uniref:Methylated-DNA--protein-cysteine methyltransferase n=1 Tax=Thalassospira profundimaris TaxID=502049 RepID=A0A367XMD4_9PROT|nr:methylated-DNA--[protein]-cysteine S-methyltransferase [Thalassospira profundimaris]RCK53961.1 cysteine methyltransferase [Thalassospira profundimaris]|tara:strand:- start:302 stop:799 length:498 start_codon:yes stop_codon:yes gene_type:complete